MDARWTVCKKCGKPIRFGLTSNGKQMPITPSIDKQIWLSHFADCPAAAEFRKNDRLNQIEEVDRNQEALNNL